MMQTIQVWLAELGWEKKVLLYATILALVPALALALKPAEPTLTQQEIEREDVTTMIPRGFVLVPIEVQNYEALDSILGKFGVVDLFQAGDEQGNKQNLVAKNVRLLRAPQNPTHFAILIEEKEVSGILRNGGIFTVVVKGGKGNGT